MPERAAHGERPEYALRAEGIGRAFRGRDVLKSASLWAEPGKVTTLMGRNGAGKTTLMRIAAGWLAPHYGVVTLLGQARERPSLAEWARLGLMYVPQGQLLSGAYDVRQHLDAIGSIFGPGHIDRAIEQTRISALLDHPARLLSGGERVRVSLALAIARDPAVLIIDEPLVGLQPVDQEGFAALLRDMAASGMAIVTSGHDARVLLSASDAIVWCTAGTTHHLGTAADALDHHQFRREYLGPGYQ